MTFYKTKNFVLLILCAFAAFFYSCNEPEQEMITETVAVPTEGMITTVKETEPDKFLIEDETVVAKPEDSRIIAKYLDNTVDTFTLQQAQLMAAKDGSTAEGSRYGGLLRAASFGLMGYMMGRSMSSHRPRPGAYTNPSTYNRVNNTAGARVNQTAKRTTTTRPSGRSGYGGGKSTRSYGG